MDDIQTWIYIIIGIIYFIVRSLKKKTPNSSEQPMPRSSQPQQSDTQRRKPLTFEELLKEFTNPEAGQDTEEAIEEVEEVERPERERVREEFATEGSTRRFSDEESKRVYEESIKKAEGFKIDYSTDEKYHTEKLKAILHDHEEEESTFADDIKEMFNDPQDAKKAVVLSEILNRKY
ncbi:MAG: hypothetical protein ACFHWX_10300 [Bacteroidota bacterium]